MKLTVRPFNKRLKDKVGTLYHRRTAMIRKGCIGSSGRTCSMENKLSYNIIAIIHIDEVAIIILHTSLNKNSAAIIYVSTTLSF